MQLAPGGRSLMGWLPNTELDLPGRFAFGAVLVGRGPATPWPAGQRER